MTFVVDKYLSKSFKRTYNCYDFVREIWLELTGVDLGAQTPSTQNVQSYTDKALQVANTLERLDSPQDPSIVLLQRSRLEPHIGVYYSGKILHLTKNGAYYMPLSQVTPGYPTVTFYK
jgi:hypothetical protein